MKGRPQGGGKKLPPCRPVSSLASVRKNDHYLGSPKMCFPLSKCAFIMNSMSVAPQSPANGRGGSSQDGDRFVLCSCTNGSIVHLALGRFRSV